MKDNRLLNTSIVQRSQATSGNKPASRLAMAVWCLLLASCTQTAPPQPSPSLEPIPFSVLFDVENESLVPPVDYPPTVRVVQASAEIDGLADRLGPYLRDQFKPIDFDQQVGVVLLHGTTPSTGYDISLQDIQLNGTTVELHAIWGQPTPDEPVGAMVTSPVLGITIPRDRLPVGEVVFRLLDGNEEKARIGVDIRPAP